MSDTDRRAFLQRSAAGLAAAWAFVPRVLAEPAVPRLPEPVRVGLVGGGARGREILTELAKWPDVTVGAVCEIDAQRLRRSLRRTAGAEGYGNWQEAVEKQPGIMAWFVAVPTHLHREVAVGLLAAGKHVYCEAPLAGSVEDMKAIARAALEKKTVFQVGHESRVNPVYGLARSFYRSGSIADPTGLRAQWHRKMSWRTPTGDPAREKELNWRLYKDTSLGLPGEVGSHHLDTLDWFLGRTPVRVRGGGSILLHQDGREIPDTVSCWIDYGQGLSLTMDLTLTNSYEGNHTLLNGTMGSMRLAGRFGWLFKEADAPIDGWEVYANRQQFHDEQGITLIADATKLAEQGKLAEGIGLPHPELYYGVESFLNALPAGAPFTGCSVLDGLKIGCLSVACHEAVMTGSEIPISPEQWAL